MFQSERRELVSKYPTLPEEELLVYMSLTKDCSIHSLLTWLTSEFLSVPTKYSQWKLTPILMFYMCRRGRGKAIRATRLAKVLHPVIKHEAISSLQQLQHDRCANFWCRSILMLTRKAY